MRKPSARLQRTTGLSKNSSNHEAGWLTVFAKYISGYPTDLTSNKVYGKAKTHANREARLAMVFAVAHVSN
jgi:hypothetical protein